MFCHLHIHSEYSLLESSVKIKDLVEIAKKCGMASLAITDTCNMHGAIEFYRKAREAGIKPLVGCEIAVSKNKTVSSYLFIAKDIGGYENLCRITSNANLQKRNSPSPVGFGIIKNFSRGLIAISEFGNSEFFSLLQKNNTVEADLRISEWIDAFGKDFYIEIQRNTIANSGIDSALEMQKSFKEKIILEFASRNEVKITAGNNVRYLSKQDYDTYCHMIKLKSISSKERLPGFETTCGKENYFKTPVEMQHLFHDLDEALKATEEISGKCDLVLEFGKPRLPGFDIPENETQKSFLEKLCCEKVSQRYGKEAGKNIYERLRYELSVIEKMGFSGYFLIVADIARFALENKIPLCGKGSSAGSIVAYLLGISNVDPVKQGLCFERFLNEDRKDLPDIDIDMSGAGRLKVADYLASKYGRYNVLRVPVFTTFKTRASMREAGRLLSLGKEEIDGIINLIPGRNAGFFSNREEITDNSPVMRISGTLKGYKRHIAMHPCAFIVLGDGMSKDIPLMASETGEIMSQYGIDDIEAMGFLKIDLINSLTLDHIDEVSEILKKTRNITIDFSDMNYDDKAVYKILADGDTTGTFQLESMGIRSLMKKLKPSILEDITLLISLYRPGPQQSGMVDIFIERKFKRRQTDFLHEDLKEILEETCGVMLYQEQVMKAAVKIAGYSFGEADRLRKTRFDLPDYNLADEKSIFVKGAEKRGYENNFSEKLFDLISKFAGYGFVKAHAASYAEIAYKTCFLKIHYPAELLSVILTRNSGYYCKNSYIEEARRLGINIRLPDINISGEKFLVEDSGKSIRISLISIRDLGFEGTKKIVKEREQNGLFKDFSDFYERIIRPKKITLKASENLIKIGAFDFTGLKRKYLMLLLEYLSKIRQKKYLQASGPGSYNKLCKACDDKNILSFRDLKTTEISGNPGIIGGYFDYLDDFFPETTGHMEDYSIEEKLEIESSILEFCASANPLMYFKNELSCFRIIKSSNFKSEVSEKNKYKKGIFVSGILLIKRTEKTKKGGEVFFLTIEDGGGIFETVFFESRGLKKAKKIFPGAPVLIYGNLSYKNGDISVIAENITNIADLKKIKSRQHKENTRSIFYSGSVQLWKI